MARMQKTLTDYVVLAISPTLIMMLIGSLVFFLLDAFYAGQYPERLRFIMGLFVMATVLIGRISIEEGREYASLYAVPLGLVTLLAMFRFVDYGGSLSGWRTPLNIGLVALIWWCADRLTWDCTVIDEREDLSGEGLLQTAGLDRSAEPAPAGSRPAVVEPEATSAREAKSLTWWDRLVEHRRRPHAPGVWVVYFSLAALPLFGIGQRFVPTANLDARRRMFWLLIVFVASALALLMTTSLLGLRRYLRQRRLEMPIEMAGVWLLVGSVMIIALLLVCNLLPRPSAEYSITQLSFQVGSPDKLRPSQHAAGREGVKQDRPDVPPASTAPQGAGSGKPGQGSAPGGDRGKSDQGTPGQDRGDGQAASGAPKQADQGAGKPAASGQGESKTPPGLQSGQSEQRPAGGPQAQQQTPQQQPQPNTPSPGQQQTPPPDTASSGNAKPPDSSPQRPGEQSAGDQRGQPTKNRPGEAKPGSSNSAPAANPPQAPTFSPLRMLNSVLGGVPHLLKWLYNLAFFAVVGYLVWRYRDRVLPALANFLQAIRDLWANLFGGQDSQAAGEPAAVAAPVTPPRPLADFADPFATGMLGRYTPRELVAYSFEALEAWARERGCSRGTEQTPHEFAQQVATSEAALATDARDLADLYCQAAYSAQPLAPEHVAGLRRLWQTLRLTAA